MFDTVNEKSNEVGGCMMEQIIEQAIDEGLESISSELYLFSIAIGILLVLLGAYLLLKSRISSRNRRSENLGLISLVLGAVATISGIVQM